MASNLPKITRKQHKEKRFTARERSRSDTRKRLMEAWREIIIGQGQQTITINEITEKAEVAVGTFYCHFKDKESLTQEVALDSYSKLVAELDDLEMQHVDSWEEWIRSTIEAVTVFIEHHPREFMFLLRLAPQSTPEGQLFIDHWEQFWCERTESILRKELEAGNLNLDIDPVLAARSLVKMVCGLLEWWLEDTRRASRNDVVRTLTSLLLSFYKSSEGTP